MNTVKISIRKGGLKAEIERGWHTPIQNILQRDPLLERYVRNSLWVAIAKPPGVNTVQWHQQMLGTAQGTFVGRRRYHVWVFKDQDIGFVLFVNNGYGVGFEVPCTATPEVALSLWDDYLGKMGLHHVIGRTDFPPLGTDPAGLGVTLEK